jgi:hypothetical protein
MMFKFELNKNDVKKIKNAMNALIVAKNAATVEIPKELAIEFTNELRLSIQLQRDMNRYPDLSKHYAEQKKREGKGTKFWIYRTDLISSLTYWKKRRNTWYSGIPVGANKGNGPIGLYARKNEFGDQILGGIPPRPIFKPTFMRFLGRHGRSGRKMTSEQMVMHGAYNHPMVRLFTVKKKFKEIWRN